MKKIVLNKCYGGFGVSDLFIEEYFKLTGVKISSFGSRSLRSDNIFISLVEKLGSKANSFCSCLAVVSIPDDVFNDFVIDDYDGIETLHKRVDEY